MTAAGHELALAAAGPQAPVAVPIVDVVERSVAPRGRVRAQRKVELFARRRGQVELEADLCRRPRDSRRREPQDGVAPDVGRSAHVDLQRGRRVSFFAGDQRRRLGLRVER